MSSFLALWFVAITPGASAQDSTDRPAKKLTIERLYSLPWLIGTKPQDPQWSPDSRQLAFLWNDEGTNFYDVWITGVTTPKPVPITSMPRPDSPTDPGTDIAKLEQVARAETDHGVSSVIWAPDGKRLIFNFHGLLYWVLPGHPPERLVDSTEKQQQAACPLQSNRIGYISGGDLWVANLDGDKPAATKVYSPGRKDVSVTEFHWSGDGKRLTFVETDASQVPVRGIPDYLGEETKLVSVKRPFPGEPSPGRRLGIISADGGPDANVRWADLGGDPLDLIFGIAWSPDSQSLLVDKSDLYIKDRRLLLVNPETGRATLLVREQDPKNVTAEWWSDWAPDGRGIYFISDRDNDYHVYYQPLTHGEPDGETKRISAGNWAVFSASISPAANALFIVTNQGKLEERQLFRIPLEGGEPQRITNQAGTHAPVPSPDGQFIADIFSSDSTPPDLYLQRVAPNTASAEGSAQKVTHSPLPEFSQYHWVVPRYVTFPNVNDGTLLHARLTLPPNFDPTKKYPAILGSVYSNSVHNQWGGRTAHPTWGLDQYLAQQGYVILNVDISGSSGYGKVFRQRIGQDYGGVDVEDLHSGVKYLVAQGFVDEHRVGIWGSSYGGLLTAMSLFTKPGVYQAGVAGAPATSLFHALTGEMRTMMAPQDHMQQYAKSSAFLKSGALQDHLMIIHGMRDEVVLFKDSVTLEQRLILQGKNIQLVVLPNAPHGWDTEGLAQTRYAYGRLVEYFRKYLGEGPNP
ncbi:MAG: prolyl oligopeptidase family serine peptidase [Bryobacteraceae bacterium]